MKTAIGFLTLALALAPAPAAAESIPAVKDAEWCRAFGPKDPECVFPVIREAPKPPTKPVTVEELRILPPPEYSGAYTGYLEVIRAKDEQEVRERCPQAPFGPMFGALACSMQLINKRDPSLKGCRIVIGSDEQIKKSGLPFDVILIHELAHCNGWPGNHPGARPFEEWAE